MSQTAQLHAVHRPVTDLFADAPDTTLSHDQLADFRRDGFLRGPRVLTDHQIGVLREALERIRTGANPHVGDLYEVDQASLDDPGRHVFHVLGAWRIDEAFHDLLFHEAVGRPVAQLLDSSQVRLWHDQVFYKPPKHPGVVTWHQDYSYWTRTTPARHVTVWIGLDDSTEESGCVRFVPGSHRWELLPKLDLLDDMDQIEGILSPAQKEQFAAQTPMVLKAGECSFHHSHTLHGSFGNAADHPRRAIVLNFMHPQTVSTTDQPLLAHTAPVAAGAVVQGDDFPIVHG